MSTDSAGKRQPLLVMDGGPERAFRVGRAAVADDGAPGDVTSMMVTGPWLTGPAGTPGGALGVLVDNALAFALLYDRAPAMWSVSAEISLDVCGPVPADGSLLTARARRVHFGEKGGLASGVVTAPDGTVIAQCSQHTRWVPGPASFEMSPQAWARAAAANAVPADVVAAAVGPASLTELLGARIRAADGCAGLEIGVTRELANPLGNLHGGVTFCACDLAAQAALASVGGPTRTASVHVAYPRPLLPGTTARFEAQVLHSGRSLGVVRITALNDAGKPCVVASVTTGPAPA